MVLTDFWVIWSKNVKFRPNLAILGRFGDPFQAHVHSFEGWCSEVGGPIGLKIFSGRLQVGGQATVNLQHGMSISLENNFDSPFFFCPPTPLLDKIA